MTVEKSIALLEATVSTHRQRLVALAAQIVGPSNADDIVQNACLRAFQNIGTFQPYTSSAMQRWLSRIVRNCAIDARRGKKHAVEAAFLPLHELATDPAVYDLYPEEGRDDLRTVLAALRPIERKMLLWRANGATYDELAIGLGLPVGTIRVTLHRSRIKAIIAAQRLLHSLGTAAA